MSTNPAMTCASVCSGTEAFGKDLEAMGFRCIFHAEIEPHASAVLRYHYPNVPNHGDFTLIATPNGPQVDEPLDVLFGGTPCQSFSIAGLRAGMDSDKGNLTLEFVRLIDRLRPKKVVWENVPGILSSNKGADFACFLDALEEIGYICDVEMLDAQFFGVPQRRKRIFVCAQSREDLLSQTTTTSALTISQCLLEILQRILVAQSNPSEKGRTALESAARCADGAWRRMKLFEIATEKCHYIRLRQILVDAFQKFPPVQKVWELPHGAKSEAACTLEDLLMGSPVQANPYILTEQSLNSALDAALVLMKSCITSTSIKPITPMQIFTCSQAGLLIGKLICHLSGSSPASLDAVLSFLTFTQSVTSYAEQASRNIFSGLGGLHSWHDILKQTQRVSQFIGHSGDWRPAAAVLFEPESLSGHPAPRAVTGQDLTGTLSSRATAGGGLGTDFDCAGGLVAETAAVSKAFQQNSRSELRYIDGDGQSVGAISAESGMNQQNFIHTEAAAQPMAFDTTQITSKANMIRCTPGDPCHTLPANGHAPAIAFTPEQKVWNVAFNDINGSRPDRPLGGLYVNEVNNQTPLCIEHSIETPKSVPLSIDLRNSTVTVDGPTMAIQAGGIGEGRGMCINALPHVSHNSAVRRLLPVETEALMGWARDWTAYGVNAKGVRYLLADGPRYRLCGNGWVRQCILHIAERLLLVDGLMARN